MSFQKFDPHGMAREQNEASRPRWMELSQSWKNKTLEELRDANAYWFSQPIAFELTAPSLWLINQEMTSRGVAPQWRGVPRFVNKATLPAPSPHSTSLKRLGDVAAKNLMKRWVDLEWLRIQLGPLHVTKFKIWKDTFAADLDRAVTAFARVNVVWAHGGGKLGTKPAHKVVDRLNVPKIVRLGLTGLIDRDSGELIRNMEKRVQVRIRPRLEALTTRAAHPLTKEEVERRLLYCQAIELAVGSPTDGVKIFRWMTGESITRQSVHEMQRKIAEQCKLTTRAWRPLEKRTESHPLLW